MLLRRTGSLVALLLAAACAAGPDATASVAIGTFNIRYDNPQDGENAWPKRRAMVADVLREGDLWGLQEVLPQQVAALREDLPEFGMVVRSRDFDPRKGEACPILFRTARWALDERDHGTFWLSETPEKAGSQSWDAALPRIATYARLVDVQSGRGLYVFNVHLDHRGPRARLESCKLLLRRIAALAQPDPVVVLGDFNAGPARAPLRALLDDATIGLVDAWRVAHPRAAERGTFNGWEDSLGERRIDHLLPGPGLVVASCEIDDRKPDGRWPSDHAPVCAVLRFGSP